MKNKSADRTRVANKVILIGIALGALYWILESAMHAFLFHKRTFIEQILTPSLNVLWIRLLVLCVLIMLAVYAHFIIAERKRAEEALRESEQRFRRMAENVQDGLTIIEQGKVVYVNDRACEIFGYPKDELVDLTGLDVAAPEEKERLQRIKEEAEQRGIRPKELEFWIIRKDGTRRYIRNRYSVSRKDGQTVGRYVVTTDITERKRAEEALREGEERFRAIFEQAADSIVLIDAETGALVEFNDSAHENLGYTRQEFENFKIPDIEAIESAEEVMKHLERIVKEGADTFEAKHRTKSGEIRDILVSARAISIGGRDFVKSIWRDITEHRRAEEEKEKMQAQLLQSQKMEAMGILASGIAHHFNNLLGAILGYAELAMMQVDAADPLYADLKRLSLAAERGASLTRQLLLFSRKGPMKPTLLNINRRVDHLLEMLKPLIGEDIAINIDLEPDLWTVRADGASIEQVIMNLVVNAREAMPKGGDLTIKTENVTLDEEHCKAIPEAQPGRYICLSVVDTGVGMDEDIMQHIFDPFFTTKEVGKGAGLGLPVVYGVVKQHEGWINVYSEPGQGSTFEVFLPALAVKPEGEIEETISLEELQGSDERILLVEDEEGVREFLARALGENGYIVFEAANAKEAMDIFKRKKGEFHLVFTDVVLPDSGGLELVDQLLSRNPQLRVLLSSGYADDRSQWPVIRERGFQFLQKPYALANLLRVIREVIESG